MPALSVLAALVETIFYLAHVYDDREISHMLGNAKQIGCL
jgi:hypothetical protein